MTAEIIKDAAYICIGTDMRKSMRRIKAERREMLRYEPGLDNRRSGVERRRASAGWDKLGSSN